MPRRGRSGGFGARPSASPSPMRPAPSRPVSTMPAHPPPAAPATQMAQPKQPGLFAQMASTAAGVAVGSAVGHTIGHAMTGGGGSQTEVAPQEQAPAAYSQQPGQQQEQQSACQYELKQFLDCAQGQADIGLCQGFNEALRQCKARYGKCETLSGSQAVS
ncbi:coiled-coil-helix-coiled-coil-helix domain-containing protein 2-like [Liolophura sinensis]|uniref:coiled-coil-helix-coiled-coil-helix domain-containing protein 2-like n=1 Tax=Liolophura sinensis TaxID=3198878 RepID=UPI003158EC79